MSDPLSVLSVLLDRALDVGLGMEPHPDHTPAQREAFAQEMRAAVQAVLALSRQLGIKPPPVDLAAAMRDGSTVLVNLPGIGECECFVAEAYNRTTDRADYGYAGNWLAPQARELSCDIRLVVSRRLEQPYLIERVNRPGRRKKP